MIRSVISMSSSFYSDSILAALDRTGNFRAKNLPPGGRERLAGLCREFDADLVILGISWVQGFRLEERRDAIVDIRDTLPGCKIVLYVDEAANPDQLEGIKSLRFARLIDAFVYASCTMEYLIDTLESVI